MAEISSFFLFYLFSISFESMLFFEDFSSSSSSSFAYFYLWKLKFFKGVGAKKNGIYKTFQHFVSSSWIIDTINHYSLVFFFVIIWINKCNHIVFFFKKEISIWKLIGNVCLKIKKRKEKSLNALSETRQQKSFLKK